MNPLTIILLITLCYIKKVRTAQIDASPTGILTGEICDSNPRGIQAYHKSFTSIVGESFRNCSGVVFFQLYGNHIKHLPPKTFQHFTNLTKLDVSENEISTLQEQTFVGLGNLEILNLFRNNIESIDKGAFIELEKLHWLHLGDNHLNQVSAKIFEPLSNLKTLNLWKNHIESIHVDAFFGLDNLQFLYMYQNPLRIIDPKVLKSLKHLEEVDVAANELLDLNVESILEDMPLKYIGIKDNNFECGRLQVITEALKRANVTIVKDEPPIPPKYRSYAVSSVKQIQCVSEEVHQMLMQKHEGDENLTVL